MPLEEVVEEETWPADTFANPLWQAEQHDLGWAIEEAVASLPARYRAVVVLRYLEDLLKLDQAKNSLWSAQSQRDAIKGRKTSTPESIASAEAAVANAEVSVRLAEIAYEQAQTPPTTAEIQNAAAQVQRAQDEVDRLRNSPTAAELAAAQAQVAQAEANVAGLLRGPSAEELGPRRWNRPRIALEQTRRRLVDARIVAPFDGIVADIGFEVGDQVGADGAGIVLVDLSGFHVDVQVDETEVGQIQVGQPVLLTVDAYPDVTLKGKVTHISEVGHITQGVVTYVVRVDLAPTDLPLRADMTTTATITVAESADTSLVPTRALRRDTDGDYVEVLQDDGSLRKLYMRVGLSNDAFTEVLDGLREGDQVVIPNLRQNNFGGGGG